MMAKQYLARLNFIATQLEGIERIQAIRLYWQKSYMYVYKYFIISQVLIPSH